MRGDAAAATLLRPRTAEEAIRLLSRSEKAVALAGGTDVMVAWNAGALVGATFVDLSGLRGLHGVRESRRALVVGALATHADLAGHAAIRRRFPPLAAACATVGGVQIQNRGTLGGNIANASPAGDTFPPLAVYEAVVVVRGPGGRREIPFDAVFAGVKKTVLLPGELIEAVRLPFPKRPTRTMFRKVGTRAAQAISKVVAAGLLWLGRDGRIQELRFALGSVAPTVRRLRSVEAFVAGQRASREVVHEAARLVAEDIVPIDDVRSTAEYRLAVSRNLVAGFLSGTLP
jgi:CO/xanthine dehydrogenase FAD-binding subunit